MTFDQPLIVQKASEIVLASPKLSNVVVRLGGFHLLMSNYNTLERLVQKLISLFSKNKNK